MRTSLNNIKAIDDYISGRMAPGDALIFEANILLNDGLKDEVQLQQNTYAIIRLYSRQRIKDEIMAAQRRVAATPQGRGFMERIAGLFK